MMRCVSILIAAWFSLPGVFGAQIRVPADHATIQQGINAAANGDTVVVAPGTYNEAINYLGKDIAVVSSAGPAVTIVDGNRTNRVVTISGTVGRSTRLEGFTIRNGSGGVSILNGASATIANNRIITNTGCSGIGMEIRFASPLVISNLIAGNFNNGCGGGQGGGIYVGGAAAAEIVRNVITNNGNGGIALFAAGTPTIRENVIGWNTNSAAWGGINVENYGDALIVNNLIIGNGGIGIDSLVPSGRRGSYIINNTIVENRGTTISGIRSDAFDRGSLIANNIVVAFGNQTAMYVGNFNDANQPIMQNNNFYSATGAAFGGIGGNPVGVNGNLSVNPSFVGIGASSYRLSSSSLCINSGDNSLVPAGVAMDLEGNPRIRGTTVDMGAYEFLSPTSDVSYYWLQQYGFPRDGSADYSDPDGDGMNNWQEWRSGTDPTNSVSLLRLLTVSVEGAAKRVTWQSVSNRVYVLERATNLAIQPAFSMVASNIAGQAGTTSYTDMNANGSGPFFYRAAVR